MRVGIDCGGTFTDAVLVDSQGVICATTKVNSTSADPSQAVLAALEEVAAGCEVEILIHGSTVATNAVLERKGDPVGLIVTKGFRDVLALARQDRTRAFDLRYSKPVPLVSRSLTLEVTERIDSKGNVITPLDMSEAEDAVQTLLRSGVGGIAISLLHSYANPYHEQELLRLIRMQSRDVPVSISSIAAAEFREYERTTTTVVDAFVRPVLSGYIKRLASECDVRHVHGLALMQSSGGMTSADLAERHPVRLLFSGPAAGVAGAAAVAAEMEIADLITLDMGGTSTDVCVLKDRRPLRTYEARIGHMPVLTPTLDLATVGAGGGSVVSVDAGGLVRIGPESVGAFPGPACYCRGGELLTLTDVNVARGLIRPENAMAGKLVVSIEKALGALKPIAEQVGQEPLEFSENAFKLGSLAMADAMRLVTVERGIDPRKYTLLAYGGAGPLHAAAVAEEMGMDDVVVPPYPGLVSAFGLLTAEFRVEAAVTHIEPLATLSRARFKGHFETVLQRAYDEIRATGRYPDTMKPEMSVDLRYQGQGYEMNIRLPNTFYDEDRFDGVEEVFRQAHTERYGHAPVGRPVEVVTYRVMVYAPQDRSEAPRVPMSGPVSRTSSRVFVDGQLRECAFLRRESLPIGFSAGGPVVVEEDTATTFVPPRWQITVDASTSLRLSRV